MKASDARKRTKKAKRRKIKEREDARKQDAEERERARNYAREKLDEVYAELEEKITRSADNDENSTRYRDARSTGNFNTEYTLELGKLVEKRLIEDGYTTKLTNRYYQCRANEGQDEPYIEVKIEISW